MTSCHGFLPPSKARRYTQNAVQPIVGRYTSSVYRNFADEVTLAGKNDLCAASVDFSPRFWKGGALLIFLLSRGPRTLPP